MNGQYCMWDCYRGSEDFRNGQQSYRIGFAVSDDGLQWTRRDNEAGISVSSQGWDEHMTAYPEIARLRNKTIMLYNGNMFGAGGFGYAELID